MPSSLFYEIYHRLCCSRTHCIANLFICQFSQQALNLIVAFLLFPLFSFVSIVIMIIAQRWREGQGKAWQAWASSQETEIART